jgi:hypothetical protein
MPPVAPVTKIDLPSSGSSSSLILRRCRSGDFDRQTLDLLRREQRAERVLVWINTIYQMSLPWDATVDRKSRPCARPAAKRRFEFELVLWARLHGSGLPRKVPR